MSGDIVLGYDGSPCARAALHEAAIIAKALGRRVIATFGYATNPMGGENQDQERLIVAMATKTLDDAVSYLQAAGVEVEIAIIHDRPAASLLDVAAQREASLIVVGTNGESPMLGAILGSVPQKLLHRSPIPVLVVPAPALVH
jgi:nucleotide-binding universal stress UspA family protein